MLAVILSGVAILISGVTVVVVLVLLGRKEVPYSPSEDDESLVKKVATLIENQKVLWYALEDMDDRLDDAGLSVLRPRVPNDQATTRHR